MATGRRFAGKRQPLTLAFGVLVAVAIGAGCNGFFTSPTLTSITINPTAPSVELGQKATLSAYGVYSDGTGNYLTSGVSWSTSDATIAALEPPCDTKPCGNATLDGVSAGTATITAGAQSVTNTADAKVYLGSVTNFEVCEGTFGSTTSCSSGSTPLTWPVVGTSGGQQYFVAQGVSNGTTYDLTTASTWTLASGTPSTITCTNSGTSPETCTVGQNTTIGTYNVTVTYPPSTTAILAIKVQ